MKWNGAKRALLGILLLVSCSKPKASDNAETSKILSEYTSSVVGCADGSAYVQMLSGEIWYVRGDEKAKVDVVAQSTAEILPMADGSALLSDVISKKMWRLRGTEASPIRTVESISFQQPPHSNFLWAMLQAERRARIKAEEAMPPDDPPDVEPSREINRW